MRIIITGATGFVGRNLAETLHKSGHDILGTGRSREVGDELRTGGIEFRSADITDFEQLDDVLTSANCLIHCAAKAGDWGSYREFSETNVLGTRNIVEICKRRDISRIIFISTPSLYFTGSDRLDISESEPLPKRQKTYYSRTKLICERELFASGSEGIKSIVLRPRAVYGPYDTTIAPRMLHLASKKNFPLINDGKALVDITYAGNLSHAVERSLAAPDNAWNEVYNISNGDPITVRQWFTRMLEVFDRPFRPKNLPLPTAQLISAVAELICRLPFGPKRPALTRFSVGYMARSMTLSIEKARRMLGYTPRYSNEQSFQEFADWYRLNEAR
jgi:nucleoside-diphosphate-sugar epimerase